MSEFKRVNGWSAEGYTFEKWESKVFGTTYTYSLANEKPVEHFESLEHAMAAAIAERVTGETRGAGGSGVGTAADWFMDMLRGRASR